MSNCLKACLRVFSPVPIMLKKLLLLFTFCCTGLLAADDEPRLHPVERIAHLKIKGSINPATLSYLKSSFQRADSKADMLVIEINTPGGLVTTTKDIIALFGESSLPVVVWVRPSGASATSAGAIIASAAHFLFMGRGTNIGAATPVALGNSMDASSDQRKKAVNDLAALVESLSGLHKRNPAPFRQMIEEASSFSSQKALEQRLIDGLADEQGELEQKLDKQHFTLKGQNLVLSLDKPEWTFYPMDLGQTILNTLANPSTAYILFLLGLALLYLELQAPGGLIAGGIGALSLIMAAISFQVLPVSWGALGLIVLSFVLLAMEMAVTSYGILSLGGLTSLAIGSLFLFRSEDGYLQLSSSMLYSVFAAAAVFIGLALWVFLKESKENRLEEYNSLAGLKARVIEELPGAIEGEFFYQVKVGGEIWRAKSRKRLNPGDFAEVEGREEKDMALILKNS